MTYLIIDADVSRDDGTTGRRVAHAFVRNGGRPVAFRERAALSLSARQHTHAALRQTVEDACTL